jgi:5-methylthioadenosine/S-adenosylhomocysteine deaminase
MDTLIRGATIVTCDAQGTCVKGDLLLQDGKIVGIGSGATNLQRGLTRVVEAAGCAVIPGFVQSHVHLCQTLMRGHADDLPLLDWLRARIWPLEAAHNDGSLAASADLGLLEMMRAGTTAILDMGTSFGHDVVLEACVRSGVRALSGKAMMDAGVGVPKRLRETTQASLRESDRLAAAWPNRGRTKTGTNAKRVGYAYAPRFILSCSETLFRALAERMQSGAYVHSHAAEHPEERKAVRKLMGADDIDVLASWGIMGPRAIFAHGVQLTDTQMRRAAKTGTRFVHCPSANLKLGSGIARVERMLELGMQVGLGADGAPCNNTMDPWAEMRLAALLSKVVAGTTSLAARRALELATIGGARVLGLDDQIGSIEVGKDADLCVVRTTGEHTAPTDDIYAKLVYSCQSKDVTHVFVQGDWVVRNGEHTRLDAERTVAVAYEHSRAHRKRANLS